MGIQVNWRMTMVPDFGNWLAEHAALGQTAGVFDFSSRGRLCLIGGDRLRFLHGQVTNDVKRLRPGEGCYAALVTAKGKMESDLNIFCLADELLLDFEPGLTEKISQRLEKYIVADDVQLVDAAPHYSLLSVQGPKAQDIVRASGLFRWGERPREPFPSSPFASVKIPHPNFGEIYVMNNLRLDGMQGKVGCPLPAAGAHDVAAIAQSGLDLFILNTSKSVVAEELITVAQSLGGRACGWQAFEIARIEAGIPRFGVDMDETNLPLECGIESRAISYRKGCYIGQEVINRVHSFGHVTKELRGLRLADDGKSLPQRHDKLFKEGKEVGYITSAVKSPKLSANIALGYVRREANEIGTELVVRTAEGESRAQIVGLPFVNGALSILA